jgi:ribosome-binding protein aMBF1 (putative translation factor)
MKGFKSFISCAICGGISIRIIVKKDNSEYGLCRECYDSEYRSVEGV